MVDGEPGAVAGEWGLFVSLRPRKAAGKKQKKFVFADRFIQEIDRNERVVIDRSIDAHPLIDIPKDWEATNETGRYNTSGGYHLPQVRKRKPLLRNSASGSMYGAS